MTRQADSLERILGSLPLGWFVYAMGEKVKPQIYRGDEHDHIAFYCELQHRRGGRLTKAEGSTIHEAITAAIASVEEGKRANRWSA